MSIQFSDTTAYKGLVQFYEDEAGYDIGDVSGNTKLLKKFTALANLALDDFWAIAIRASGRWQLDDSNHTDYPIIKANLVSGQQDYTFTTDESGNTILDIYRVFVLPSATETTFQEIYPIDQQSQYTDIGSENTSATGTPFHYDKTANALFLDPKPNYNATNGLKVMINREASYFSYQDTTKKPGVPGLFHAYFYLKPALNSARNMDVAKERKIKEAVMEMEAAIKSYYSERDRDTRPVLEEGEIMFQ